jgi:K+-transporting ATPase c subunit
MHEPSVRAGCRHPRDGPATFRDRVIGQAACIQAPVVARARHVALAEVVDLIDARTDGPTFGFIGSTRINVLDLTIALDELR